MDWSPSRLIVAGLQYGIGIALLPFEPQYGVLVLGHHLVVRRFRPLTRGERLYATLGIAFHTVGVIYPEHLYRAFVWYDDVAHVVSGSLLTGLFVAVFGRYVDDDRTVVAMALLALLPVGIGWEMYEFRVPRLTVYGWRDTATDFWFNVLGGVAMVCYLSLRRQASRLGRRGTGTGPDTNG